MTGTPRRRQSLNESIFVAFMIVVGISFGAPPEAGFGRIFAAALIGGLVGQCLVWGLRWLRFRRRADDTQTDTDNAQH